MQDMKMPLKTLRNKQHAMHAEAMMFKIIRRRFEHKQTNWFFNRTFVLEILGVHISVHK